MTPGVHAQGLSPERRDKTRGMIRARPRRAAAEGELASVAERELASVAEADGSAACVDTVRTGMAAGARDGADRTRLLDAARYAARYVYAARAWSA